MKRLFGVVALIAVIGTVVSKKAVIEEDDYEEDLPSVGIKGGIQMDPSQPIVRAAKVEYLKLLHRFEDESSWSERGSLEVSKDS